MSAAEADRLDACLRAAGQAADPQFELLETALALAALDRPEVPLARYRSHLDQLMSELAAAGPPVGVDAAAVALRQVLAERYGYAGDRLTYDDMQNANLMRVIDRRRGLPVALGILYIGVGEACGLDLCGLCFPAHFLLRLDCAGERRIIDPFDGGSVVGPEKLRALAKQVLGEEAELDQRFFAAAPHRQVLLRLQNNIHTRALRAGELDRAEEVLQRMLLFAPQVAMLHRSHAVLLAGRGQWIAALAAAERCLELTAAEPEHQAARQLVDRLRRRLN